MPGSKKVIGAFDNTAQICMAAEVPQLWHEVILLFLQSCGSGEGVLELK